MQTSVVGYPRIGTLRELKFALEKYFRNEITATELQTTAKENGIETKPVITGAYTLLKLCRYTGQKTADDFVDAFAAAYKELLTKCEGENVKWIQFDEPALVWDMTAEDIEVFKHVYKEILSVKSDCKVLLQTYFGDVRDVYEELVALPFDGIGLDFIEGKQTRKLIEKYGFPKDKLLFAGLVNGKNIWKNHYARTLEVLSELKKKGINTVLSTSCSLLHVPYTLAHEKKLGEEYLRYFAFANEKLTELSELKQLAELDIKANNLGGDNNEKNVLNHISVEARKNQSIALIGRTGSGKTSLVNLLCRFYDLNDGTIKINGIDYKEYSIRSLRDKIGYIMQKVVIFDGTILENINYANKDISKEEIIEICKKLNLHEKIMSLKDGYETKISSDTDIFSTGEKQLLNFTRVMVENPEIIILDEATASLSYKSEMLVRKAIEEITKGKISFIIAHRLSTIKNCDKILLMKDGKIIEEGNHNELMEKHGEYYELVSA